MITIDEAIAFCENQISFSNEEYRKVAEWLEELKLLRELKNEHRKIGNIEGYNQGYKKAIDDFAGLVEKWCWKHEQYNQDDLNELMEIAERLKAGGTDE